MAFLVASTINAQNKGLKNDDEYAMELIRQSNEARQTNFIKSLSYIQEALKLENGLSDTTLRHLYHSAGITYKDQISYFMALNYFYKELDLQNSLNPSESFFILNNIGGCYYHLGDYKKARDFWEKAVVGFKRYSESNTNNPKNIEGSLIYNNLAVIERVEGNYAKALEMFNEFKSQNELYKDTFNIIMAYENLSSVYYELNEYSTAIESLHKGIRLSKQIRSNYDLASLYSKLGNLYYIQNIMPDSAFIYLDKAYKISSTYGYKELKLVASEKLVNYYENKNDYKSALSYLQIAKSLSEETIKNENEKQINRLEFEFDEKMRQNELILSKERRERYFILGIVLLCLSSFIALLMFKLQKSKSQKRFIENQLLAKQLEEKNKELTGNAIQMLRTSEIIEMTHKELKEFKSKSNTSNDKMLSQIITELRKGTQVFNKREFEKVFLETDGEFYKKLLQRFPELTKNEIRLCAFMKMNLSSKEISAITQQSPHSIVVARSRLRKKLMLDENQSLTSFLNTL